MKDLFQYIGRYKPHEIELMTTLKCFVPEYIPSIGEIDSFIKVHLPSPFIILTLPPFLLLILPHTCMYPYIYVYTHIYTRVQIPRPDGKADDLGLKYIDEPAPNQSDPTVLELQLRATTKKVQSAANDLVVRSIDDASKNTSAIDKWINNITDLHASKPPQQVIYKHNYPDSETLMAVWPEAFEEELDKIPLPSPDLDLPLAEYSKLLCSLLDIPTYDNPVESLHVLFTLYSDFKNNPHFQGGAGAGAGGGGGMGYDIQGMSGSGGGGMNEYGDADVMEIDSSSYNNNNTRKWVYKYV